MSLFIVANCNILEKYYIKYSFKSLEKIRETLQTTIFNPCVKNALPFFCPIYYE